tara:strand:- start:181 stop:606 length:426 start_codon:yes stop_codon:yes gene_type:complete
MTTETETRQVDYNKYAEFVNAVTSFPSQTNDEFIKRIEDLDGKNVNIARLLTAAVGISAEGGEFTELVKKIAFQGKELNSDVKLHMIKEMGDVMWYMAQACMALDIDLNTVLTQNMVKLMSRYPDGTFDVYFSENRKEGDL